MRINVRGEVLDGSRHPVNPAGFVVHAAIHDGLPGAHCVMHTHTTSGMGVACLEQGLSQSNFYSAQLHGMVAYHDFEGITIHAARTLNLEEELGSIKAGKTANFTVLLDDPFTVAPMQLKDIEIWGTVFKGELHPVEE